MKRYQLLIVALAGLLGAGVVLTEHHQGVVDAQVAAGEWKVEIQTPPCDNVHNLQVIWPKESGSPMTVECDSMPVVEK